MADLGKMVIIIGDGMGDWPVPELEGNTPLEAATKPNLDRMAREGENGVNFNLENPATKFLLENGLNKTIEQVQMIKKF
jgi:hypothetical protein